MRPHNSESCDNVCDVVRCLFIAKAVSRMADIAGKPPSRIRCAFVARSLRVCCAFVARSFRAVVQSEA